MEHIAYVEVVFPRTGASLVAPQVRVAIEDTSEVDAAAVIVSQLTLQLPILDLTAQRSLRLQIPYAGAVENLWVSATVRAGDLSHLKAGDLITAANVRVRARGVSLVELMVVP